MANVETGDSMAVALGKLALLFSKLGDPADLDPEATDIVAAINSLNTKTDPVTVMGTLGPKFTGP